MAALVANLTEVSRLTEIHTELTGDARGRRRDVDILNKSGIVLAVACWESFVEDLATHCFDCLLEEASSPDVFPPRVLALAGQPLRLDKDERRIWTLAGKGWHDVLRAHRTKTLDEFLGSFHTPRPAKVDALFESLVGLRAMSTHWKWRKNSNQAVLTRLEKLIDLRGRIAHRVTVDRYVTKDEVFDATDLVSRMAAVSSNVAGLHLKERTGSAPWSATEYGSAH